MTWLRREAGSGGVITMIDAWTSQRLTGAFVSDASTASRSLLLDLETTSWSNEACALFEIDPATLPEVVDCNEEIGETTPFGGNMPVTGLPVAQQAVVLASQCLLAGHA